ncbi:response regulator [Geoglobus sp.]
MVLIVEDDDSVMEVLKIMLSDRYTVIEARNGREAVEIYRAYKPDIVLMDVVMPELDGIAATREIKKIDPSAKIIGVTAYAKKKAKELIEAGALEVLEKPFSRRDIVSAIEKHLEG